MPRRPRCRRRGSAFQSRSRLLKEVHHPFGQARGSSMERISQGMQSPRPALTTWGEGDVTCALVGGGFVHDRTTRADGTEARRTNNALVSARPQHFHPDYRDDDAPPRESIVVGGLSHLHRLGDDRFDALRALEERARYAALKISEEGAGFVPFVFPRTVAIFAGF